MRNTRRQEHYNRGGGCWIAILAIVAWWTLFGLSVASFIRGDVLAGVLWGIVPGLTILATIVAFVFLVITSYAISKVYD